ncbi:nuclease-related domain-containing protein [Kitasatospora sp. NPDC056184]|uniref:nuclease-related domain-containing protein n=1 Tax=Kitasatospora sp. NPDC056184 TaxID=3345738 RepID=UPI0035E09581
MRQIVGARLDPLEAAGWEVLHRVLLLSGADIDHMVIGPSGVFVINSKQRPGVIARVSDRTVKINCYRPAIRTSHPTCGADSWATPRSVGRVTRSTLAGSPVGLLSSLLRAG